MKQFIYTTILLSLIGLNGCSGKAEGTYSFDKAKTINHVQTIINQHRTDRLHSAVAVAMDDKNNYIIGYSYAAASKQSARNIAIQKCKAANQRQMNAIAQPCQIYVLDNKNIRRLQ